ncbi:MAG: UbiX family flavin prenyltransferase [Hydrogenibacillus schlegelii]|nr:UbiX family flavin prenyltransferase [Hydrogenibacillus schlegelii]
MRGGRRFVVALTGASGIRYGLRAMAALLRLGHEVHAMVSDGALRVAAEEEDVHFEGGARGLRTLLAAEGAAERLFVYDVRDIGARPASGTFVHDGMLVIPCSMNTLAAIAHGVADNLITRSADATLKEGRPLVLVPRETPLSAVHLENMLKLARLGVRIVAAMPAFYPRPKTVDDIVDFVAGRALDAVGVTDHGLFPRWKDLPRQGETEATGC